MIKTEKIIAAVKHIRGITISSITRILALGIGAGFVWMGLNNESYLLLLLGMAFAVAGMAGGKIYFPEWSLVRSIKSFPNNLQQVYTWVKALYYLSAYRKSIDPSGNPVEIISSPRAATTSIIRRHRISKPKQIPEDMVPLLMILDRILTQRLGETVFFSAAIGSGVVGLICIVFDPFSALGAVLWGLGMAFIMIAAAMHDGLSVWGRLKAVRKEYRDHRWAALAEISILILMTFIAFDLRATNLESYPPDMHGDESELTLVSLDISNHTDTRLPPFTTGWLDHPTLFNYLQAASMDLFGRTEAGTRMISVLFGTACVPLMYLIGRKVWGRVAGMTSAWLLAVSALHIQFSRRALNNMASTFFLILMMLFIYGIYLDAEKRRESGSTSPWNWGWFAGTGLIIGLAQYMYFGSHVLPVIAGVLLLILLVKKRISFQQIGILVVACFLAIAPLVYAYTQNPMAFVGRMQGVSVLSENYIQNTMGPNVSFQKTPLLVFGIQLQRNLGFFIRSGDSSNFYTGNLPQFDIITEILFWLGLAICILRIRHFPEQAAFGWFAIGVLTAGMMTSFPPNGARLIVPTPSVFLIAGIFAQYCLGLLESIRWLKPWVTPVSWTAIALVACIINYNTYFITYGSSGGDLISTYLARTIQANCGTSHIYLMAPGFIDTNHGTIKFLTGGGCAKDIKSVNDLPEKQSDGKPTRVLTIGNFTNLLAEVNHRFPNGQILQHNNPEGTMVILEYVFDQNR